MGNSSINAQFSTGELLLYWLKTRGEFLGRSVRSGPGPALVILPKLSTAEHPPFAGISIDYMIILFGFSQYVFDRFCISIFRLPQGKL